MLFIALTGLGYVSYKQLPVELLPNAELPMLFVQVTSAQDMDPSYVESEVVIPIERGYWDHRWSRANRIPDR
ncbi:MAG: hypothetical protein ACLR6J_10320 [Parabacteroides merdae]